ncbi:hypothetical protein GCM10023322_46910 [Rugosimonospora acidiphila]|uniref:AB hydrolase-1 domain-containing protein n=1 Tax=Rugosimonospora acidiphila TaxID=556531 RepID=A0ABP9S4R8_9ACTN
MLDGHGVSAAHLVGASLGGVLGQWLAVHHPERVLTLTALTTTPMDNDPGRRAAIRRARRLVEVSYDRASDYAAARQHDLAGARFGDDRYAALSAISAPPW